MKYLIGFYLLVATPSFGQEYLLENESIMYGFNTNDGEKLVIARDTNYNYIVVRFGTDSLIQLEYPQNLENSWEEFKYSYYLRGGGIDNAAMDLNSLSFIHGNYRYVIYDNYYSESGEFECGITFIDIKTGEEFVTPGDHSTTQGSLISEFRWNDLIPKDD